MICELLLWGIGFPAWWTIPGEQIGPRYYVDDFELGWRLKPGRFVFSVSGTRKIGVSILSDGRRVSGDEKLEVGKVSIALFGGSFVEGWGLDDRDTLPWILGEQHSGYSFLNYGVPNYGTYQSFLRMKEVIDEESDISKIVYYFNDFHEGRNVGVPSWRLISGRYIDEPRSLPILSLGAGGELKEMRIQDIVPWEMSWRVRLVALLNDVWNELEAMPRRRHMERVSELLLLEMHRYAQRRGIDFSVMMFDLSDRNRERYKAFFDQSGVEAFDCSFKGMRGEPYTTLGNHPNRAANVRIAECMGSQLAGSSP